MEFKKGDRVAAFGLTGVVCGTEESITYPIAVRWDNGCLDSFMEDGRLYEYHKEPSIKLIERPKSRKKIKMCAFVWKDSAVSYQSASDVQEGSTDYKNRLVNNKFFRVESKDYEIEVEE